MASAELSRGSRMLDFYNALADAVKGRLREAEGGKKCDERPAHAMDKVNDDLKDLFERFELTATDAGVEVRPVLVQATAARILDGLQQWPNGIEFAGRDIVRDEQTGRWSRSESQRKPPCSRARA